MSALADISAAVLVGGLGTRLRGVVDDLPKPLAPVNGRPFLAYLLDQLVAAGVPAATLCTGYLGERVAQTFGDAYGPMRLTYSQESQPLGTAGALRLASDRLTSDPVLVLNGDSYCAVDLAEFVACYRRSGASVAIALAEVADTAAYGLVELDAAGHVRQFREKQATGGPGLINAGIYLISRTRLGEIPPGKPVSLERDCFPAWTGSAMMGWRGGRHFIDIGTPESYRRASEFLAGRVDPA
ncbi:MAG: nucleotidyltransferase family protein [Pirellulales bacterium]|nr:nucleotidyltransferase family protein [Pirellulales bacterium]